MNWDRSDVILFLAFILLLGVMLRYGLKKTKKRWMLFLLFLFILSIVWIEMAVGLFGTPLAGK